MEKVIGIGEFAVSQEVNGSIKTYALASCVAVTAYSSAKKVGGMIHIALPAPTTAGLKAKPGYYATTGIPLLMDSMCSRFGCRKDELVIQLYGGANSIREDDMFNIGKRNLQAVTDTLTKLNFRVHKAEVGGTQSRTIEMDMATGNIRVIRQPITI